MSNEQLRGVCGGCGLPEKNEPLVFWTAATVGVGILQDEGFFYEYATQVSHKSASVLGWVYLDYVLKSHERDRQRDRMVEVCKILVHAWDTEKFPELFEDECRPAVTIARKLLAELQETP